jgi:hypothetical protein
MRVLRKFGAALLFVDPGHLSSFPAISRCVAVQSGGQERAACPPLPPGSRHSRQLDATSTVLGVNVHGPRDPHSRMCTQR